MPTHGTKQPSIVGAINAQPTAVLYSRVSSKEQEQGYSICAQEGLLRSYGTNLGLLNGGVRGRGDGQDNGPAWICGGW